MANLSNGGGDAVRLERMLSLKRSQAGHLAYLNRLYKDVELLMRNADNYHKACKKEKDVEITFVNIFNSPTTPKLMEHNDREKGIDERFEEWSQFVQHTVDDTSVVPCRGYSDNAESQIITRSVVSSSSRKSKSSKTSSCASDWSRKANAELLHREVELQNLFSAKRWRTSNNRDENSKRWIETGLLYWPQKGKQRKLRLSMSSMKLWNIQNVVLRQSWNRCTKTKHTIPFLLHTIPFLPPAKARMNSWINTRQKTEL